MTQQLISYSRTPRYKNALSPAYPFEVTDETGAAIPITGALTSSWHFWMQDVTPGATTFGALIEGTGTFSIVDGTKGLGQYQWSAADLSTEGIYTLIIQVKLLGEAGYRQLAPDIIVIYDVPGSTFMAIQDINVTQVLGAAISTGNPLPTSGPITIADGSDVATGSRADAAYAGSGNATVVASLKGVFALLAKIMPQTALAFSGTPPTQTQTGAAVTLTPTATAYQTVIQNNTAEDIHVAFGATATVGSLTVKSGTTLFWTEPVTSISIAPTTSQQNINGTAAANIVALVYGI